MSDELSKVNRKLFEDLKQYVDGVECWDARDLQVVAGYTRWQDFESAISKAMVACENGGESVEKHFLRAPVKNSGTRGRPGVNFLLTRTACYYVFQNGDPRKPEIAGAQAYFIYQTRQQERQQERLAQLSLDQRRIFLRDRVESSTESLSDVASMQHDVTDLPKFHRKGQEGMYNMDVEAVEALKDIANGRLLDFIDSPELAAHYFRITQTEMAMGSDAYDGYTYDQEGAENLAYSVGTKVRSFMQENGKMLPEDMPGVDDIEDARQRINEEPVAGTLPTTPGRNANDPTSSTRKKSKGRAANKDQDAGDEQLDLFDD